MVLKQQQKPRPVPEQASTRQGHSQEEECVDLVGWVGGQGSILEEGQSELHFEERVGIFQAYWDKAGKIVLATQSCPTLCNSWTVAYQALLSMEFSRQEYWSGYPFPSPRDLPDSGIKPRSPAFQADYLTSESPGKAKFCHMFYTSYYGMFLKYLPISTLRHLFFNFCYFTS